MKYLRNIIIIPLHEIIDNIYKLLSHAPSCQTRALNIESRPPEFLSGIYINNIHRQ